MVIVGLGNPGEKYKNTRHNIGFEVIDALAEDASINLKEKRCLCLFGEGKIVDEVIILAKPQTYMNHSGVALKLLIDRFNIKMDSLIIIHDDVDLSIGKIRIRQKGGGGGHKGLLSIMNHLNTSDFIRVKVGVGAPINRSTLTEYVLSKFEDDELDMVRRGIDEAVEAVKEIVTFGVDRAMNRFNYRG